MNTKQYCGELVGLSDERCSGSIRKWEIFLKRLDVRYIVSKMQPEKSVELANSVFRFSSDYCFFRKSCLGQFVDLVHQGCDMLLIPVKVKDGYLVCNSTRFMAMEVAEYYRDKITVLNLSMFNSSKKEDELRKLAQFFSNSEEKIEYAMEVWGKKEGPRTNVFMNRNPEQNKNLTLMMIGKINHFFDYTNPHSPMMRYLTDKLSVNVMDPENVKEMNVISMKKAYRKLQNSSLKWNEKNYSYWPHQYIVAAIYASLDKIDGILFVREHLCTTGVEEINILQRVVKSLNIPNIIINYSLEAQSTIETSLETFTEMLEWKKKGI